MPTERKLHVNKTKAKGDDVHVAYDVCGGRGIEEKGGVTNE
jgi:hypothetical protein